MSPIYPPPRIEAPERHVAWSVLLLVLALYTATFSGLPGNVDGEVTFQTTSSLWREGTLALGGTPEAEGLIEYARAHPEGAFSVREGSGAGAGRYYGWFGIGQSIVALPFYAVGRGMSHLAASVAGRHLEHQRYGVKRSEYFEHLLVGWRNPLLGALTAMLVTLALLRLSVDRKICFLGGIGYGLCTFAWPQARDSLGDVQAAFFLTLAVYSLLRLRQGGGRLPASLFGLGAAFTLLTRIVLAPAVLVLDVAVVLSWIGKRKHPKEAGAPSLFSLGLLIVAPQLLAAALWLYANHLRFDDLLDSGYAPAIAGGLFGGHPLRALLGLLVSPGKGLLWMAPGLLLLHLGIGRARDARQRWGLLVTGFLTLGVLGPILFLRGWEGAWTYGPRYVLPALPALWVLAATGFHRSSIDPRPRRVTMFLLALGLLTQLPGVLVDTMTYHELAVQAARETFEVPEGIEGADREAELFEAIHFDWGFAEPWVHWRILRHRVAGRGEGFDSGEIFLGSPAGLVLTPAQERERGYRHLAWKDLAERLDARVWPGLAVVLLLLGAGIVTAVRGLDP